MQTLIPFLKSATIRRRRLQRQRRRQHPPKLYVALWEHWSPFQSDDDDDNVDDCNTAIDWDSVVDKVRRDPSIAHYCDERRHGMVLLHFVCALQPPLRAVEAVIQANPDALQKRSLTSETIPLMMACGRNASPEVIRRLVLFHDDNNDNNVVLIDTEDTVLATSLDGYAAIHWACREDVSASVVKELLHLRPEIANLPVQGNNMYARDVTPIEIVSQGGGGGDDGSSFLVLSTNQWEKLSLLLRAGHYGTIGDDNKQDSGSTGSTIHAALALHCQDAVIWEALARENPDVMRQRDKFGKLPLHYAVQEHFSTDQLLARLLQAYPEAANCEGPLTSSSSLPSSSSSSSHGREHKQQQQQQQLPLHTALASGYTWSEGIQELFECNKAAISKKYHGDNNNNNQGQHQHQQQLYPFALAAAFSDLDATFHLLRESPDLVVPQ